MPKRIAISGVTGHWFAWPRTPSVPKIFRVLMRVSGSQVSRTYKPASR
jgi:hypothetical protein